MKKETEIKETWKDAKGKLKQKFAQLIDEDVLLFETKHGELLRRLQVALGKTKEEIHELIFKK